MKRPGSLGLTSWYVWTLAFVSALSVTLAWLGGVAPSARPTVGYRDAAIYALAVESGTVPHQPGASLFIMVGRVFRGALLPIGVGAGDALPILSWLVTLCATLIWVHVVFRLARPYWGDRWGAMAAGAAGILSTCAFTPLRIGLSAEKPYALVGFAVAAVFHLLHTSVRAPGRRVVLAAYSSGLALAIHPLGWAVVIIWLTFAIGGGGRVFQRNPLLLCFVLLSGAVGSSARAYAPVLRSHSDADVVVSPRVECSSTLSTVLGATSFGIVGCDSAAAFLRRDGFVSPSPGVLNRRAPIGVQVATFAVYLRWQWGRSLWSNERGRFLAIGVLVLMLSFALWGTTLASMRLGAPGAALATLLLLTFAGVFVVSDLGVTRSFMGAFPEVARDLSNEVLRNGDFDERDYYYYLVFQLAGVTAGIGLISLTRAVWNLGYPKAAFSIAAAASMICLLSAVEIASATAPDRAATHYRNLLLSLPDGGVLVSSDEGVTAGVTYLDRLNSRTGMRVLHVGLLWNEDYYAVLERAGILPPWRSNPYDAAAVADSLPSYLKRLANVRPILMTRAGQLDFAGLPTGERRGVGWLVSAEGFVPGFDSDSLSIAPLLRGTTYEVDTRAWLEGYLDLPGIDSVPAVNEKVRAEASRLLRLQR